MSNQKNQETKVSKVDFKFVGQDRKVYDKEIEGKPIGYFQDAMIRFRKNKANMVAATILLILILMAIFVPIVTTKNYENIEEQLTYLAPRVPVLEKFGILDGFKKVKSEEVDLSTIDPNNNLGLPVGYDMQYVKEGTLTNFRAPANNQGATSLGGEVVFSLTDESKEYVVSNDKTTRFEETGVQFTVDVTNVADLDGGKAEIYLLYRLKPFIIGEITSKGVKTFDLELPNGASNSKLFISLKSGNSNARVDIRSIKATYGEQTLIDDKEFGLYSYVVESGVGSTYRVNHTSIFAAFVYDQYSALFSSRVLTIGGVEYDRIRSENLVADPVEDPDNPGQFNFEDEYVIKRIISKSELEVGGELFTTYQVEVDYAKYMGYSSIPYFLFGTDASGRDLFALTWVGLRTSLIIGVIVSIINITFGVVYGAISGYYGGKVDLVMERFTEIIGRIPWLVTLSIFTALIGPGFLTLILILIISGWIGVASVTRTQFYRYKNREYVLASRTLGAKDGRLIFRHILPNGIGTIITSSILMIPGVIFSESSISYLGFGIGHGQEINLGFIKLSGASLGVLLADGQVALLDFPHLTVYPAIIISILMITFNMFGNGLRDAFNPSLRGTE